MENTQRLVDYIRSLPDFELVAGDMLPNEHMGATLRPGPVVSWGRTIVGSRTQLDDDLLALIESDGTNP